MVLKLVGVIALGLIAWIVGMIGLFDHSRYWGQIYSVAVLCATIVTLAYYMNKGKTEGSVKILQLKEMFSPFVWGLLLTAGMFTISGLTEKNTEDDLFFSTVFLGIVLTWMYLMWTLADVRNWKIFSYSKPVSAAIVLALVVGYGVGGFTYMSYRWKKFVPQYVTEYEEAEKYVRAYPERYLPYDRTGNTEKRKMTNEEIKQAVEQKVGPYPIASNYKSKNTRWFFSWWLLLPVDLFTHIFHDIFDYLWTYFSNWLDSLTSEQLKNWKK